jgi:hypothetical protein
MHHNQIMNSESPLSSIFYFLSTMAHLNNNDPDPKFHTFLNLPIELQIDIWKYSLTVPQIIRIKSLPRDIQDYENTRPRCVTEAYQTPPPLHVCRRSRDTALQFYRLTFERRLLHPVYLNPRLDEVKLIGWDAVHNFSKPMDYPDPEYAIP